MISKVKIAIATAAVAVAGLAGPSASAATAVKSGASNCVAVHKYKAAYISQRRVYDGKHQFKVTTPVVWVCDGKIVGVAGASTTDWNNF